MHKNQRVFKYGECKKQADDSMCPFTDITNDMSPGIEKTITSCGWEHSEVYCPFHVQMIKNQAKLRIAGNGLGLLGWRTKRKYTR